MSQTTRRVNDGHQMDGILGGSVPSEQPQHYGKGQAPSAMKDRNTQDHVDAMMHASVKPVQKWDKMNTACIQKSVHSKKIINNTSSHYSSRVFDPASPAPKTAPTALAGKATPVGAKDHIKFGASASPAPKHIGTKRTQAADHVDAVLHSIPPEAKKVRHGSAEEQKNKSSANADHVSVIFSAPAEPKITQSTTSNATKSDPLKMDMAPSDRSAEVRSHTGKKLIAPVKAVTSAIPYETSASKMRASRAVVKDHNKSSVFSSTGDEENTGRRQAQSNSARDRMLGSHVLGSTQKGNTPVKRSGIKVSHQATSDSMGSIFNWG